MKSRFRIELILSLFLLFSFSGNSQTSYTIPDANFAAFLNATYPSIMTGNDMDIAGANAVTGYFNCSGQSISDLSGIEHFTGVNQMNCSSNNLTTLDVSTLNIYNLFANNNQLTSVTGLENLTNLHHLWLYSNQLVDISNIAGISTISNLYLSGNNLTSFPALSNFPNLGNVTLGNNPRTPGTIDVSMNTNLYGLECSSLNLTGIIGIENTNLSSLDCRFNQITDLSGIVNLSGLTKIWVNDNELTNFPSLTNLSALQTFWIYGNPLSSVTFDVSACVNLKHFSCGGAPGATLGVDAIDGLANCVSLEIFSARQNNISDLSGLAALPSLKQVTVNNNQLTSFPTLINASNLTHLVISSNPFTPWDLDVSNNPDLVTLEFIACNVDNFLGISNLPAMDRLFAQDNNLTSVLGIENSLNIKIMYFDNNNITEVPDFSNLSSMTSCRFSNNKLDFSDALELQIIDDLPLVNAYVYSPQQDFDAIDLIETCVGDPFEISITPQSLATSYQWYIDGNPIAGATSSTYALTSFTAADAGTYRCNSIGSALLYPTPMSHGPGISEFTSEPISVVVDSVSCTGSGCGPGEVEICHVPPGNPANAHTICVGPNAVNAHLNHGDYLGACVSSPITPIAAPSNYMTVAPNPFNNSTTMTYYLVDDASVSIEVVDVFGNSVNSYNYSNQASGEHSLGLTLPKNGVYTVLITIGGTETLTSRIVSAH